MLCSDGDQACKLHYRIGPVGYYLCTSGLEECLACCFRFEGETRGHTAQEAAAANRRIKCATRRFAERHPKKRLEADAPAPQLHIRLHKETHLLRLSLHVLRVAMLLQPLPLPFTPSHVHPISAPCVHRRLSVQSPPRRACRASVQPVQA